MLEENIFVPEGWTTAPLSACVDVLDSRRKPVNSRERAVRSGRVPYYGATGQVGWIDDYLFDEELVLLGEDGAPFLDKSKTIAYVVDGKSWVNNHAHVLRARPDTTTNRYIKHYLDSFDFTHRVQGSTRDKLTQGSMRSIPVLLAPRPVQDALVETVDSVALSRSSASGHLALAKRAIERFRQAVLVAASSGHLTADWRFPVGLADEELPSRWELRTVESLAAGVPRAIQSGPFGSNLKHGEFQATGKLVIGIDNVLDGRFSLGRQNRISEEKFAELAKYEARPLDVLVTVMGTVGRVCVVPSDVEQAIITKHVYRISVDRSRVEPHYLMHALRGHPDVLRQIHYQTIGQTRPGINGKIVKGLVLAIPPLAEQGEIVRRVERLLSVADVLTKRIEAAGKRVDHSAQAVLAKAFGGELTVGSAT